MKKNKDTIIVYSTDPNFVPEKNQNEEPNTVTLEPQKQDLRIALLRLKANKLATIISGFVGTEQDLNALCKVLKQLCGVGGTVKNGEIHLQGDVRSKVEGYLSKQGYKYKRKGG
ncbi:MAG: translation initiation factor [Bacteroidia bacterium]|nr:translation initiation factor [Bacteroidia bacterium]MDW8302564.1 translation initiation factor [Bacteroidia bacterium]